MPVASLNPDNFIAGGLKDDFIGTVRKARFCPWDYAGKLNKHILGFRMEIELDPEFVDDPKDKVYVQHWSAGDLEQFAPSNDGENPVDLSAKSDDPSVWDGTMAVQVGKKPGLSNSSNFAFFIRKAIEAKIPADRVGVNVATMFEGLRCRFNRVPQPKRSGLVTAPQQGDKKSSDDTLVITEILGNAPAGASTPNSPSQPAVASSSPAATPSTPASGASADLDGRLVAIVQQAVRDAGGTLPKGKLAAAAMKALPGADKGKGVKRVIETPFLESLVEHGILFDGETGTLTIIE